MQPHDKNNFLVEITPEVMDELNRLYMHSSGVHGCDGCCTGNYPLPEPRRHPFNAEQFLEAADKVRPILEREGKPHPDHPDPSVGSGGEELAELWLDIEQCITHTMDCPGPHAAGFSGKPTLRGKDEAVKRLLRLVAKLRQADRDALVDAIEARAKKFGLGTHYGDGLSSAADLICDYYDKGASARDHALAQQMRELKYDNYTGTDMEDYQKGHNQGVDACLDILTNASKPKGE